MSGALSRVRFADGGAADQPFTPNYGTYAAATNPDAINDPYVASSAASQPPLAANPAADQLGQFAGSLTGNTPLSDQYSALKQERDANAAAKVSALNRAMAILQAGHSSQTTNLPMLAAAGAMLAPTRTGSFAESLGNGFSAAVAPTEAQRQQDFRQNAAIGELGTQAAGVPLQMSEEDMKDLMERARLAEQAQSTSAIVGGRQQVATTNVAGRENTAATAAAARVQAANIAAGARVDWATINAQKGQWTYLGLDPNDSTKGLFLNKTLGTVNQGPAVDPKNAQGDPARIREANVLVQKGVVPDFSTAYSMVRSGVNDANQFGRLVQAEKNTLLKEPQYQNQPDSVIEAIARKNVADRAAAKGTQTPGAPSATPAPAAATPTPAAAPANANYLVQHHIEPAAPPPIARAPNGLPIVTDGQGKRGTWDGKTFTPLTDQ